jgi:hypothetical protein
MGGKYAEQRARPGETRRAWILDRRERRVWRSVPYGERLEPGIEYRLRRGWQVQALGAVAVLESPESEASHG